MQKVVSKLFTKSDTLTVFAIVWTIGLSFGLLCGRCDGGTLSAYLYAASSLPISPGVLLATLPVFLCIVLSYFGLQYLIFPLSFIKAFFDGFVLYAASYAFGSALWIVFWPLFFADRCINLLFLCLCSHVLLDSGKNRQLLYVIAILILVVFLDYFLASPWLHKLML